MYTNSRTYAQKLQSGLDLGYLIDLGGFLQDLQDTWKDLKITKKDRGLSANRPALIPYLCSIQQQGRAAVLVAGGSSGYSLNWRAPKTEKMEGSPESCSPAAERP
jgi:hypothetical protein